MLLEDLLEVMQSSNLVLTASDGAFDGEISGTAKTLLDRLNRKTLILSVISVALETRFSVPVLHVTLRTYFNEEAIIS